jgi:2-oxoglutarate dehydrogenase E2 component (dihydrolipoamide succinyltransferase)
MNVTIPEFAESVSEGDLGRWLKADGDFVRKDEPLLEIETDKTTLEIPANASGRLTILMAEGETVTSGVLVGTIAEGEGEEDAAPAPKASVPAAAPAAPAPRPAPAPTPVTVPQPRAAVRDPEPKRPDEPGTRRVRMSRLRRSIAERLVEAQRTAAILTTFNEVDMSELIALRKQNQEWFVARHGVKLGYVSLFGKAVTSALQEVPEVNAFIEGDEVVYHDRVHLGIAVGTDKGLVVPVVRNADQLSLGELEKEIQRLAGRARDGDLALADLQGGTFTISNGGIYGSLLSTPILNPPQSGILGMHSIEQRARVLPDGSLAARPMMFVALSYDHRIVDGKEAVTFLVKVKERLEDPERMLLDA